MLLLHSEKFKTHIISVEKEYGGVLMQKKNAVPPCEDQHMEILLELLYEAMHTQTDELQHKTGAA